MATVETTMRLYIVILLFSIIACTNSNKSKAQDRSQDIAAAQKIAFSKGLWQLIEAPQGESSVTIKANQTGVLVFPGGDSLVEVVQTSPQKLTLWRHSTVAGMESLEQVEQDFVPVEAQRLDRERMVLKTGRVYQRISSDEFEAAKDLIKILNSSQASQKKEEENIEISMGDKVDFPNGTSVTLLVEGIETRVFHEENPSEDGFPTETFVICNWNKETGFRLTGMIASQDDRAEIASIDFEIDNSQIRQLTQFPEKVEIEQNPGPIKGAVEIIGGKAISHAINMKPTSSCSYTLSKDKNSLRVVFRCINTFETAVFHNETLTSVSTRLIGEFHCQNFSAKN
jgi:hypothetical protein